MMKKKQIIVIAVIALIAVGLGVIIYLLKKQDTVKSENPIAQKEESKETGEDLESQQVDEKEEKKESQIGNTTDIRSWFEEDAGDKDDVFPYLIPNSSLSIRALKSYRGVFIEDGSDKDVSGIAAIILDNKGSEEIEYAKITLKCEGKEYIFEARTLAAGATMVVQESSGAKYVDGEYKEANAQIATMEKLEMSEKSVKVSETETGALQITNISDADIPCVRVFYKFYMEDVQVAVGGITYTSKITELKAGETRVITPSHYDKDASRVMMVRTYDTY